MLHMQHAQLAGLFMEKAHQPQIQFPAVESPEHQRQLELVRDSLLRRPELRTANAHGA